DISGPKLDVSELKGMVISVTGRIDNESGVARIFIKSTSQIAPRRAATAADQAFGQNHPDTRKYAELVQELDSQRSGADQTSVKPVKTGVNEYTAAEARKHIGETATVVGKVECIGAGRTYHYLELDACMPNSPFWIIVNDNA